MCRIEFTFSGSMEQLTERLIEVSGDGFVFLENDVIQRDLKVSALSESVYRELRDLAKLKTPEKFVNKANVSIVWYLTELSRGKFELETMKFYDVWYDNDVDGGFHEFTVDEVDSNQTMLYAKYIKLHLLEEARGVRDVMMVVK